MVVPIDPNTARLSFYASAVNIQRLVELEYVRVGNEVLGEAMITLQSALTTTQSVLQTLAKIQQFHNAVTVSSLGTFAILKPLQGGTINAITASLENYNAAGGDDIAGFTAEYKAKASAFFTKPITPQVASYVFGPNTGATIAKLDTLRTMLANQISSLYIQTPAASLNEPNSLFQELKVVYNELPSSNMAAITKWLQDGYEANLMISGNTSKSGEFQSNITNAITAAENLNNTNSQKVRNYMFLFEEFYKSAAAMLSAINDIIMKMSQGIAR